MISQRSTVTVVLLTFEALVVALVPVVVATYPLRHLHHKEAKVVEQRRLYSGRVGDFQIRQSSSHTHTSIDSRVCLKHAAAVVSLTLVVSTITVVVTHKTNYSLTQTSVDSHVCQKRDTAAVLLTILVLTIKVVLKKIQYIHDNHKEQPRTTPRIQKV